MANLTYGVIRGEKNLDTYCPEGLKIVVITP